jgi:beta-galactosidase
VREGIERGGERVALRSVGFPYWDTPAAHHGRALDALVALRVPILRVDVPWSVHERAPGVYEWGGRTPELALDRLLESAHARGLLVAIRPGPWLGPAAPNGGLPGRVLRLPGVAARDQTGAEQALPSVASEVFWGEAELWLAEVSAKVAPHLHPRGPVALWLASGLGPEPTPWGGGLLDHSAPAQSFFARFLEEKYARGVAPPSRAPIGGPRRGEDLERALAWIEAGETAQHAAIARVLALRPALLRASDDGEDPLPALLAIADHPAGAGPVAEPGGAEQAAALAMPAEAGREFASLRLLGMRAGELEPTRAIASVPLGEPLFGRAGDLDPVTAAAVLAMSGARAFDFTSLCPRAGAEILGTPLGADGRLHEEVASAWRELFRTLDAIGHSGLERRTDCLLLVHRGATRLREACADAPLLPSRLGPTRVLEALRIAPRDTGLRDRPELDHDVSFAALFDGLRRVGIKLGVACSSAPRERLARERAIFVVSFERMSRPLAQRLVEWAHAGGTLVLGPRLPGEDWRGTALGVRWPFEAKDRLASVAYGGLELRAVDPVIGGTPVVQSPDGALAASAPLGRGRIVWFGFRFPWQAVARDAAALARLAGALATAAGVGPRYAASDPEIETELFEGPVRRFLFVANPTRQDRSAEIALGPAEALREVRGSAFHVRAGERLVFPARSVLVREIVSL